MSSTMSSPQGLLSSTHTGGGVATATAAAAAASSGGIVNNSTITTTTTIAAATTTTTTATTAATTTIVQPPLATASPAFTKAMAQQGTQLWMKQPKANAELTALTYGALVSEMIRDLESATQIQDELDRMGHSIGIRCIEEVLAKVDLMGSSSTSAGRNSNPFLETAEWMKLALRMFLGITVESYAGISPTAAALMKQPNNNYPTTATVAAAAASTEHAYTLRFVDNPLALFVELPEDSSNNNNNNNSSNNLSELEYSQLIVGMVRGMLEMLRQDCTCRMTNSILSGGGGSNNRQRGGGAGDCYEITVQLNQVLQDGAGEDYQEE